MQRKSPVHTHLGACIYLFAPLSGRYDGAARYPKVYALAERTAAYAPIAAYLKTSKTFYSGLDGLTEYGV